MELRLTRKAVIAKRRNWRQYVKRIRNAALADAVGQSQIAAARSVDRALINTLYHVYINEPHEGSRNRVTFKLVAAERIFDHFGV